MPLVPRRCTRNRKWLQQQQHQHQRDSGLSQNYSCVTELARLERNGGTNVSFKCLNQATAFLLLLQKQRKTASCQKKNKLFPPLKYISLVPLKSPWSLSLFIYFPKWATRSPRCWKSSFQLSTMFAWWRLSLLKLPGFRLRCCIWCFNSCFPLQEPNGLTLAHKAHFQRKLLTWKKSRRTSSPPFGHFGRIVCSFNLFWSVLLSVQIPPGVSFQSSHLYVLYWFPLVCFSGFVLQFVWCVLFCTVHYMKWKEGYCSVHCMIRGWGDFPCPHRWGLVTVQVLGLSWLITFWGPLVCTGFALRGAVWT